ncbi:hypothetical protein I551_7664 [Mycobacterium ulcerans str. Harvey]|uniref:Biotin carboxylation domain-containing protein n=1 Tax=Mycobacterium ulcerans str. Harvey TaxID=1299332 RepID=A0ABN0QMX1_MYCUL|nr:hypothetical protein I551_7664 [Mycobacterium ulcerans str. Harvey]
MRLAQTNDYLNAEAIIAAARAAGADAIHPATDSFRRIPSSPPPSPRRA